MRVYAATIEIPINFTVAADSVEEATQIADDRFSEAYALVEGAVTRWRETGEWPPDAFVGNRYDDTEIEEVHRYDVAGESI